MKQTIITVVHRIRMRECLSLFSIRREDKMRQMKKYFIEIQKIFERV